MDDLEWLAGQLAAITEGVQDRSPSEWAEEHRYLPASVTPMPGYYSYAVVPYLREIVDCLDVRSSVREVTVIKGAQVGATVGVLENAIGYLIAQVRTAPAMMLTADAELAKLRMDGYIVPMIQQSGLADQIKSTDEISKRKEGKTDAKISWLGGGSLLPFGAVNANKLRSFSIRYLLEDEIDGYPERVGKDGDPIALAEARTHAYHQTRKVLRLSTPTIKGQSRVEAAYLRGDQRRYLVPCKACGHEQALRFAGHTSEGVTWGLVWETDSDGRVRAGTVRYLCERCQAPHVNADKASMLAAGRWEPTATPAHPSIRSYHVSALYSPPSMYSWEAAAVAWCDAWDVHQGRPRDLNRLQVFYNNALGEPFELRGRKLSVATVSLHRRTSYRYGQINNEWLREHSGGPAQLVTGAVDVHADNLRVAIVAWTAGERATLIDYHRLDGDTSREDDPTTWAVLREILERREYVATDGRRYRIALTVIDAGFAPSVVIRVCSEYETGVVPVVGRSSTSRGQLLREFAPYTTQLGTTGYRLSVDLYKDMWHAALGQVWDGAGVMPERHFSAPAEITDAHLRELTSEYRRKRIDKATGRVAGFEWHRPSGAANELWDLLVYSRAAIDLIAWNLCVGQFELPGVDWPRFWAYCEDRALYWRVDPTSAVVV